MAATKRCYRCGNTKTLEAFYRNRTKSDGRTCECRACVLDLSARRRNRDREAWNASARKHYHENLNERRATQAAYRERHKAEARERSQAWHLKNRPLVLQRQAIYRFENRSSLLEQKKVWYQANKEHATETKRAARGRRPEYYRALNRQTKARLKAADPEKWNLKIREASHKRRAIKRAASVGHVDLSRVLMKYGMVCHICGGEISGQPAERRESLTFDHIIPLARGGAHAESNLAPAHYSCNSRKHVKILHDAA